jgi:hypothetical protein
VVARYKKLNLPTFWAGINPTLEAKFGPNGEVSSVAMSYSRDYAKQQLGYASMYR